MFLSGRPSRDASSEDEVRVLVALRPPVLLNVAKRSVFLYVEKHVDFPSSAEPRRNFDGFRPEYTRPIFATGW